MNKIIDFKTKQKEAFFESNIWDLTNYPDEEIANYFKKKFIKYRTLDFTIVLSENKRRELKTYFKALLQSKLSIKFNAKNITYYFYLLELANQFKEDSFLDMSANELKEIFEKVAEVNGITKHSAYIITNFYIDLMEAIDTRTGFDRDLWHIDNLKINKERLNIVSNVRTLNFRNIRNSTNRDYVKIWLTYLLGCTEYALSTISNHLSSITIFLNEFENTNASDITEEDVDLVVDDWREDRTDHNINKILNSASMFYKYFEVREDSQLKSPVKDKHFVKENYIPSDNLVSENVILQMFKNLHTLPLQERCMYLINYSAGLRISDICQIRSSDCLYFDDKDGYYLKYYCQKMQKPQMNLIPPSLYKLLQEQQALVKDNSKYLFPAPTSNLRPVTTGVFANRMNTWIKSVGIKNDDGTPCKYRSHAYRHTLATDLLQNYNVDIQVIQLAVLQHKEIQMTLTYAQRGDNFNRALHDKYISNYGEYKELELSDADGLQKKALGNGYCGYPEKLGTCPYSDVCLNCEFFRTSRAFLDIHKKHLEEVRKNIVLFKANGWTNNLVTAEATEKTLLRIIEALEKI